MRLGFQEYFLDPDKKTLHRGAERISLTPIPFRVLTFLVENHGRVVSREEFLREVWQAERDTDTVEYAIRAIRRALRDEKEHPRFIQTVPGHGYCFIAEVSNADHNQPGPVPASGCEALSSSESPSEAPLPPAPPTRVEAARIELPEATVAVTAILGRRSFLVKGGLAVGLGAMGLFSFGAVRRRRAIELVSLDGQKLTATDRQGSVAWQHHFDRPLMALDDIERRRRVRIVQWSSAERHVVVAARHPSETGNFPSEDALYCFADNGRLLWIRPIRLDLIDAYGKAFEPGWFLSDIVVTDGENRPARVWIAVVHHLRFASGVAEVSAEGTYALRYANAGHVQRLCGVTVGRENLICAGGVNNAVDRTCVALFGEDAPSAMSPDQGVAHYHYRNEPSGSVRAYVLLPGSEYNALGNLPYSHVAWLYSENGSILMRTFTGAGAHFNYSFEFTSDLRPIKSFHDSGEPIFHQTLETQGIVKHSYAACPERSALLKMKRWTPADGWHEMEIPWSGQDRQIPNQKHTVAIQEPSFVDLFNARPGRS